MSSYRTLFGITGTCRSCTCAKTE